MENMFCRALGHKHAPILVGSIAATNDTVTVYACERCNVIADDTARQKIERKRIRRGERITA